MIIISQAYPPYPMRECTGRSVPVGLEATFISFHQWVVIERQRRHGRGQSGIEDYVRGFKKTFVNGVVGVESTILVGHCLIEMATVKEHGA
jgi:hypothetical protein